MLRNLRGSVLFHRRFVAGGEPQFGRMGRGGQHDSAVRTPSGDNRPSISEVTPPGRHDQVTPRALAVAGGVWRLIIVLEVAR